MVKIRWGGESNLITLPFTEDRRSADARAGRPPQVGLLDSVYPVEVQSVRARIQPASTLFCVLSKAEMTRERARARRDFERLIEQGGRVLRVHLGAEIENGLDRLCDLICAAVAH